VSPGFLKEGVVEVVVVVVILEEVGDLDDGVLRDTGVRDRETVLFGYETKIAGEAEAVVVFLGAEEDLTVGNVEPMFEGRSVGMLEGRSVGMLEGRIVELLRVGFEDGSVSFFEAAFVVEMG